MSSPRARIGVDNFGDIIFAEIKADALILTTAYGQQIVLPTTEYAALLKYVEAARVAA